jgi:hypothetical protein
LNAITELQREQPMPGVTPIEAKFIDRKLEGGAKNHGDPG